MRRQTLAEVATECALHGQRQAEELRKRWVDWESTDRIEIDLGRVAERMYDSELGREFVPDFLQSLPSWVLIALWRWWRHEETQTRRGLAAVCDAIALRRVDLGPKFDIPTIGEYIPHVKIGGVSHAGIKWAETKFDLS